MTTQLYPQAGQLSVKIRVSSVVGGRSFTTVETGTSASSSNVRRDIKKMYRGAIYNAMYLHNFRGGNINYEKTTVSFALLSSNITYVAGYDRKRINRKGKYYTMVRKNNRIVGYSRWSSKGIGDDYENAVMDDFE